MLLSRVMPLGARLLSRLSLVPTSMCVLGARVGAEHPLRTKDQRVPNCQWLVLHLLLKHRLLSQ